MKQINKTQHKQQTLGIDSQTLQRWLLDANCEITMPVMFMEIKGKLKIFSKGKKTSTRNSNYKK